MGRPKRLTRAIDHPAHSLYEQVRRRVADAVDSVCDVAGGTDGRGNPKKMTQGELAHEAGIPRATLCNYLSCRRAGKAVAGTPTLRDIVGIAHALNVPPAFLLFTEDDWARLDAAIATVVAAVHKEEIRHRMPAISEQLWKGGAHTSEVALELAPVIVGQHSPMPTMDARSGVPRTNSQARMQSKNKLLTQGFINPAMVPRYARFKSKSEVMKSAPDTRGALAFLLSLAMATSNGTVLDIKNEEEV